MRKEPLEQQFAEILGQLVKLDEMDIPSIEAKVHDLRAECQKAYELLSRLEVRVMRSVKE